MKGTLRRTGNGTRKAFRQLDADGWHEKALTANGTTESTESVGSARSYRKTLKYQLAVIWEPNQVFEIVFRLVRRPGLKRSHFPDRKVRKEGEQGSIAKRWSRRTKKKC